MYFELCSNKTMDAPAMKSSARLGQSGSRAMSGAGLARLNMEPARCSVVTRTRCLCPPAGARPTPNDILVN